MALTVAEEIELETLYELDVAYHRQRKLWTYFEGIGPTRRELYAKHMEFFAAGADHTSRLFLKGNRVGGTDAGCCEVAYHLIGEYPAWWEGKRFAHPTEWWVAGVNGESTRNTLQEKLMGTIDIRHAEDLGTGFIPGANLLLDGMRGRHGVSGGIEFIPVRHSSGGTSTLGFKSFEQGHKSFQGTAKHGILLDELCPLDVLTECSIRIAATGRFEGGILLWTIAPEEGLTTGIQVFLPEGEMPQGAQMGSQHVTMASWDDVPHLTLETREAMKAAIPAYQLDARMLGRPMLGSGVVYPIARERYLCEPFHIPDFWKRGYGMDVGWNWTAVGWYAYDDETDTWYNYYCYKGGKAELSTHAHAIRSVGDWIPGVIDPAANGRSQDDGHQLIQQYRALGLHLTPAKNAVESGIYEVHQRLASSRLKIFDTCTAIEAERRTYARDKLGHIIKENDHLMDCFPGDALIACATGPRRIADMVGTTGEVFGLGGQPIPYWDVRLVRKNQRIYRVTFANGAKIDCTENHLFLTADGWRRAIEMRGNSCYDVVSKSIHHTHEGSSLCMSSLYHERFKSIEGNDIISVGNTFSGAERDCIGRSGEMFMGQSHEECMSTMAMETGQTMPWEICLSSQPLCMCQDINQGIRGRQPLKHLRPPLLGMGVTQEKLGTENTMSSMLPSCMGESSGIARAVVAHGRQLAGVVSAAMPVKQKRVCSPGLTTSDAFVPCAVGCFPGTNIEKNGPVAGHVQALCVDVHCVGDEDTYCFTVPPPHAFVVEGGLFVHNSERYFFNSGIHMALRKPVVRQSQAPRPRVAGGWGSV